ncbi:MAG: phosphoribosylglycinamide formyltransferase [Nitratireductor sp.]|nr:phosphoribosylglycinamide formyltransferase [Nitratireductor sp.]MCB1458910.1 phosphoribosylglycinamide formyltransferase [Nitratireductor sp.]
MTALIQAAMQPDFPALVKRVISNRPDAKALSVAEAAGIETLVLDHKKYESREGHEAALAAALADDRPDFICLAGYMRILTAGFVRLHSGRLVNIHPSLLPSFKGVDTHERALAAGMRIHGASVHFVTEGVDDGPVIAQAAVPVLQGDTAETLAARVLVAENRLYPHALALLASGAVRYSAGRAVFSADTSNDTEAVLFSPALPQ